VDAGGPQILSGSTLPHRLSDLAEPPAQLYLHGELPRGPAVAVVGTRFPTPQGLAFAESLAHDLTRAGVSVFSGGAEGIDTAAHTGALRAGGKTVVVAPAGFGRPYPEENVALFQRIVREGGAYLSVASEETPATRPIFFLRNSCLVALVHVVVVVEAGFISGALNAAKWARVLARPLLVVPHSPWTPEGRGCLLELQRGAALCLGARDVLDRLDRMLLRPLPLDGGSVQTNLPFCDTLPGPAADVDRVKAAIAAGAAHLDQVAELTGLPPAVVHRQILTLTLDGVLAPDPSGRLLLLIASGPPGNSTP
jgi:DNA processing protein